jgi:LmbE family N-acetylglucosaminyl deacetylase
MPQRVLVVAPHPDDESIGCGGAICLHRQRGDEVRVVFLTSGERYTDATPQDTNRAAREAEADAAGRVLDVQGVEFLRLPDLGLSENVEVAARRLAPVLAERAPGIIYLPHPAEAHPDHAATLPIVRAALAGAPPELRGYEVWSPLTDYHWVEDVIEVMARKLRAVRCYRSQLQLVRYDRAVRGLNQYRGVLGNGGRYAEAFVALEARG